MRALIRTGPDKSLTLSTTLDPLTEPTTTHLIATHACALTRSELTWPEPKLPRTPIPAYDLAGTILTSPQPSRFKPGDRVYALTSFSRQGNAREASEALEGELALVPAGLGFEEAAAVPLSALSAWQGLFIHGGLVAPEIDVALEEVRKKNGGKRVLVTAAAGGVGVWAVQLAYLAGARVVGTCSGGNFGFVKALGADEVLDYAKTGVRDWVSEDEDARAFDVVFDCIGGKTEEEAWLCVKEHGVIVSVAEPPDTRKPSKGVKNDVQGKWYIVEPNGSQLSNITGLLEKERCKAVVDSVYNLEDWEKAFERSESGHARGKVVLKVR